MTYTPESELLHKLLKYDEATGKLFWRRRTLDILPEGKRSDPANCATWNSRWAGKEALGAEAGNGYRVGNILGRKYYAHRVVWAMVKGEWPKECIDHINGDPSDNRIENLRAATKSQNGRNRGPQTNNKTGFKGVSLCKENQRWMAQIQIHGVNKFLGYHDTPDLAHAAYKNAAKIYHKSFANSGMEGV